ncbi:MAG TPA: S8 family peptidase [Cyclobacteriaceae bacterium]|nr:S8 family peptidase [Cyclobacteriaceae bacterium]
MRKTTFRCLVSVAILLQSFVALAQEEPAPPPQDWFLRDPEIDHVQGISANRVYETLLKDQPSRTVIVAIIDSGVDINHEDLKSVIWTNEDEIPDNGIDDDKNGYIDDVHGWNFIGGKDGRNVDADTYELTREYLRLKAKFGNIESGKVPKKQREEYENFQKIETKFRKLKEKNDNTYAYFSSLYLNFQKSVDTLKSELKTDSLTMEALDEYSPSEQIFMFAKGFITQKMKNFPPGSSIEEVLGQFKEAYDYFKVISEYGYNEEYNSREIVGDNYSDVYEKGYGNNDVTGPDALHGTHVAGIVAADRKNDIGIKGIADNVRIMSLRAVPNGDERDKDIANAILYAADNGASVINMSFGKSYSPEKAAVDKAVKYAEKKGILFIHAAGNDSQDTDKEIDYPTRTFLDGKEAKNWIEIGASSWGTGDDFVAEFSNYGKKNVDVFAPGVEIYSTLPNNHYENEQGTSMSAPVVTGVAAMLMSYFPDLSASEVKDIIKKSTRKFDGLKVQKPGARSMVELSEISNTGGLVNAYEAVKMAQELQKSKLVK